MRTMTFQLEVKIPDHVIAGEEYFCDLFTQSLAINMPVRSMLGGGNAIVNPLKEVSNK